MSEVRDTAAYIERLEGEQPVARIGPAPDDATLIHWARFRDQFAEAVKGSFWTLEDLEAKVASKRAFFFPGKEAALVGEVEVYPSGATAFRVLWSVGDAAECGLILPGVEALARMMGCSAMFFETTAANSAPGYTAWSLTLHKVL